MRKARAQCRSAGEDLSSGASEVKNENGSMVILSDIAEDPIADIDSAIPEIAVRKHCRIFSARYKNYQIISSNAAVTLK